MSRSVPRALLAKREAAEALGMNLSHFERFVAAAREGSVLTKHGRRYGGKA